MTGRFTMRPHLIGKEIDFLFFFDEAVEDPGTLQRFAAFGLL